MGGDGERALFEAIVRSGDDPERRTRLCASLAAFKTERALRAYAWALQDPALDVGNRQRFGEHSAVRSGLWYLVGRQRADGSWAGPEGVPGGASDVEVTGICTLAFLGAGHTCRDGTFSFAVRAAVEWLTETQRADGCLDPESVPGHAAAAAALSEGYGMSKEQKLILPAQKAVNWLESRQEPRGGWAVRAGTKPDVQTTMTCVMALKSAKIAGLSVQLRTWQLAHAWLDRTAVAEGPQKGLARPAEGEPPTPSSCGAALLARLFMGASNRDPAMLRLADEVLKDMPGVIGDPRGGLYCDYAMFQMGGGRWKTWKDFFWKRLLETQETRPGVWGSWPVRNESERRFGRAGTTAMRASGLEIYWGYQPMYEM
jgi:squalene cyclase